jgi:hypothetical protein
MGINRGLACGWRNFQECCELWLGTWVLFKCDGKALKNETRSDAVDCLKHCCGFLTDRGMQIGAGRKTGGTARTLMMSHPSGDK